MPLYYMLHDAGQFSGAVVPALTASWRQRSFTPCRALCSALLPAAASFVGVATPAGPEPLIAQVSRGLPFDRDLWRLLVGAVLLYGAVELPEIQTAPETLCRLLAPTAGPTGQLAREQFHPIQQAHYGTRELRFGPAFYRPDKAGWNDLEDVRRLANYLGVVDPAA